MAQVTARRVLRRTAEVVAGVAVMLVLIAAALWWWAGTDGSLDWTLRRVLRSQPLVLEGVTGSLRSGLRVQRAVWEQGGLRVEARGVHLEWQPTAMLSRTVQLDELQAQQVLVQDRRPATGEPMRPPESLALPVRVRVPQVAVDEFNYDGALVVKAQGLKAGYAFDGLGHELRIDALQWAGGNYQARAKLGALGDMPLDAQVQGTVTTTVPGSGARVPLAFTAQAQGPLRELQVNASSHALAAAGTAPQATVTARVTPWAAQPLPELAAQLQQVDAGAYWPQAPQTALSGRLHVRPQGSATWVAEVDLRNGLPGAWDAGRLPLSRLQADGTWSGGTAVVNRFDAEAGGGRATGEGRWAGPLAWSGEVQVAGVDPHALYSALAPQPVRGKLQARQGRERIDFDVDLSADGPRRSARDAGTATLAALELREAKAQGSWADGVVDAQSLSIRTADAAVQGKVRANLAQRSGTGQLRLDAPGLQANLQGDVAADRGQGQAELTARDLVQAQRWLRTLPGVPAAVTQAAVAGQATLRTTWRGGWRDPAVDARLQTAQLSYGSGAGVWLLRDTTATLNGRLADAGWSARARGEQGARKLSLDAAGRAGADLAASRYQAQFARLELAVEDPGLGNGAWRLALQRPFAARYAAARLDVDAGAASLIAPPPANTNAVLSWSPVRWGGGELQTAGQLSGVPIAWLDLLSGGQLAGSAFTGDLVFDARWDASLGRTLRIDASVARTRGDVTILAENAEGRSSRVPAGVRDASIVLQGRGEAITLTGKWDSERAGTADARLVTRMAIGGAAGWQWAPDAPVGGVVRAQLPRIGVWSLLAPPGWRLRGSLAADIAVGGTRSDPQLSGTVQADDLGLRSVVDGIELRDGRLRARIEGRRVRVEEFLLRGAGSGSAGGSLRASGEGFWSAQGPELQATAELDHLRASIRSDRDVTASGRLEARMTAAGTTVRGRLVADQARIQVPEESAPRLGEDVVVRNAPGAMATAEQRKKREPEGTAPPKRALDVAVDLDLGNDFRVTGRGIDTRLRGTLALAAESAAQPRLTGTIRTVGGEFRAYNQQLDIERGVLRFTGPLDDPALDVLAVRPRLEQKVGVLVSGRAQAPFIRLYSEPDLPDAEKLTLLVTGRSAPATGAETALVQQAALALLAARHGGGNSNGGIAGKFGLDALSVRRDSTEGAIVSLGKRFSRDFYAAYERSLSGALGTLSIFYDVSRRVTVRAQAGERTALDLILTFRYD